MSALLHGKLTLRQLSQRPDLAETLSDMSLLSKVPTLLYEPEFDEKRKSEKWLTSMRAVAFMLDCENGALNAFNTAWKEAVIESQKAVIETIAQRVMI